MGSLTPSYNMACFDQLFVFLVFAPSVYADDKLTQIKDQDVPRFSLEHHPRSFNLTVEPGKKVIASMLYRQHMKLQRHFIISDNMIDPSLSPSVILNFTHLLPCTCVQVYYTHIDAIRKMVCPFIKIPLGELSGHGMWNRFNEVNLYGNPVSKMRWSPKFCQYLRPSASLCWRHYELVHICSPIPNSSLEMITHNVFNLSAVDKHHQMCVQLSIEGSHHFYCLFETGMSQWMARLGPARQGLWVYLTSTAPASFSAQLCVQNESGCIPQGETYSETLKGGIKETQIYLPLGILSKGLCVQVWRSDPVQLGRRILCRDYTHQRWGLIPVTALSLVVALLLLGCIVHHITKKDVTGCLSIQRPVLLVCSSEQSTHVTAMCTLASILQGELRAMVHMALWAQSSAGKKGPGTGVADLGPLPWLHGQWDAVREAKGKVLFAWSPEATKSYECWNKEREAESNKKKGKEEDVSPVDRLLGESKERGHKKNEELKVDQEWRSKGHETEASSVTGPVFRAALSRLHGALQEGAEEHGVVLVYFKGLSHSRDIPKALQDVPRYCLPQDFYGLILELGGTAAATQPPSHSWHCWPRLRSKTRSLWLARRFADRLQEKLPQAQKRSDKKELIRLLANR